MTDYSISILSELKMTSFGPYAGVKPRSPSVALSTALCWSLSQMSIPQRRELVTGTCTAAQGSK